MITNRDPGDETTHDPHNKFNYYNSSLNELFLRFSEQEDHDYLYGRDPLLYEGDYVTHVDGWLLWKGGFSRKMTWWERVLWRIGKLGNVKP